MNTRIRRLGVVLIACYVVLFAQLNLVQVFRADELNNHPENARQIQREFNRPRGTITTADGVLLAESVPVSGEAFDRVRRYPEGPLFAHVTGWFSFLYGASGLEATYNDELAGATFEQQLRGFADLFVNRENVGNLRIGIRHDIQSLARDLLGEREGAIAAIDPRTGEVLTLWSFPSYDPNLLSTLDLPASTTAWEALNAAPGKPLLAHAYQERYFPGSTFKVVTAGVGLAQGTVTATSPVYPVERSWTPPLTTQPLFNFGGSSCGGSLFAIMRVSCNTAFARMGVETIGPEAMTEGAEDWGFNDAPPIDLPDPARSVFPTDFTQDLPKLAQASIGQNDVAATALQMAMVAAAAANNGEMVRPRVVTEIRDRQGEVFRTFEPEVWRTPLQPAEAVVLADTMIDVVERGTATVLRTPGMVVGGKTGTAQLGTEPPRSHTWIIAFAGPPGDPQVALAVVVLNQPGAAEATGGRVAGPIAKALIDAILAVRAGEERPPLDGAQPGSSDPQPDLDGDVPTTTGAPAPTTAPPTTAEPPVTTVPTTSAPTTEAPTTTESPPPTDPPAPEP